MVEKAVGIAKNMLLKCHETRSDPYLALMNIRNTPRNSEIGSPAQRLFSRRTRTLLPTSTNKLQPEVQSPGQVHDVLKDERHHRAKKYFDRGTRTLAPLNQNDTIRVRMDKTWQPALMLSKSSDQNQPRSYKIQLPSGRITRRNRRDLLRTNEQNIYRPQDDDHYVPPIQHQQYLPVGQPVEHPEATRPETVQEPQMTAKPAVKMKPAQKEIEITRSGRISRPPAKLSDYVK